MHSPCSLAILFTLLISSALNAQVVDQDSHDNTKWADAISAFEKLDAEQSPPKDAILFVGSSSIRFWDLKASFPELDAINRGFGGSQMADSVFYVQQLVLKHDPKSVVVYAGDNDIAKGKSPERVFADFAEFVAILSKELPSTQIHYIAVKPSIKRWNLIDKIRFTNQLIEAYCKTHERLHFVDISSGMLMEDGKPNPDMFVKDGLHLNKLGYESWTKKVLESLECESRELQPTQTDIP